MRARVTTILLIILVAIHLEFNPLVSATELLKPPGSGKLGNLLASIKQASSRSANYIGDVFASIPLTKILFAGGALLSLFFMFARLIIVLGPILILGAMTRESTDTTDFLKMLIEFYNQIIVALDDQTTQQYPPQ